ncbi:MAG: 30S ribosome-binding factor RbfA [Rikenellaceae bacterium]
METTRQQKVSKQIQKDISDIFLREASEFLRGVITTVTQVRVSPDLSFAKIYISVFPFAKGEEIVKALTDNNKALRMALSRKMKNQLKSMPEIAFYLDDSLEYVENIDKLLQ